MSDLLLYSDDELREELKRRARERRANTPREIVYKEFEATIVQIYNVKQKYNGHTSYLPFEQWSYRVNEITSDLARMYPKEVYNWLVAYSKKTMHPKLGIG